MKKSTFEAEAYLRKGSGLEGSCRPGLLVKAKISASPGQERDERTHRDAQNVKNEPTEPQKKATNEPTESREKRDERTHRVSEKRDERTHRGAEKPDERTHRRHRRPAWADPRPGGFGPFGGRGKIKSKMLTKIKKMIMRKIQIKSKK